MASSQEMGMKCIKYMIFITNFIFLMIGFLLISIGSTISTVYHDFELFMATHHFHPAYLMITIGVLVFVVALFGCCGTIKQSVLLINIYVFLLVILLILEISTVIAAFSMRSSIYRNIEKNMLNSVKDYSKDACARNSWDFVQERMSCCGVHQLYDWRKMNVSETEGIKITLGQDKFIVPRSCSDYYSTKLIVYEKGCLDRVYNVVKDGAIMIAVGGLCVIVVQVMLAVFAYMLGKIIRHIKTTEEMQRQEARQRIFEQLVSQQSEKSVAEPLNCNSVSSQA